MKISKKKILTLLIFVILIFIESISYANYQSAVFGEQRQQEKIEKMVNQPGKLNEEEKETLEQINEYRKQNGRGELKPLAKLQEVAKLKAEDIVQNEYFSHTSAKLGTPFEMLKANNVAYKIAGENLAGNRTPSKAVEAWKDSELHRKNILEEKYEYTGIVVVDSPTYEKVFVQIFIGI